MADDWPLARLRDHVDFLFGFAFKSKTFRETPPGIRLVRGDNVTEGRIRWGDKTRYWPELTGDLNRYLLRVGDVLIGMDGSNVGRNWAEVREADTPSLLVQRVACLRSRPTMHQGFLATLIGSELFKKHVHAVRTGSSIPHISGGQIGEFQFFMPPLPEQRAIAHILGTLDAKTELNRRMNGTLEAMARTLFKSWFVDFDPVRAKAEGRDPGLPQPLADLFPDSFENSELGDIPKGWRIGTLADFADLNPESWSKNIAPDEIEYVDLANTKWGNIESTQKLAWRDAPSRAQRILRPGDTIIGTVRPGNGSYAFVSRTGLTGSTGFAVLRPRMSKYQGLVYLAATTQENIERLSRLADGGAYPAVRPEVAVGTQIVCPDDAVIELLAHSVNPLMAKKAQNAVESRTLADLRYTLLPKLVSGDVRVKTTELLATEATS